ncbi:MAG: diguanylate cyclase [Mariprofundales bacterium]
MKVLLLDDDSNDTLLLEAMLEQEMGDTIQIFPCHSATEADRCLNRHKVDLCIIDYHLAATTNGLQWARNCYQQHGVLGPALLMLTGETDIEEIKTIDTRAGDDHSGIADFLVKHELSATTLERAIRYATKQQRMLRTMKMREMRATLFFDHAREGIVTMDSNGKINQANHAAEQLFDYAHGTMLGLFLSQLVSDFTMAMFRPMGANARPLISSRSLHQVHGLTQRKKEIPMEMSLGVVYSDEESFYTASFIDISNHLKEVEYIRQQAQTDDLTGLMNRRHFRQQADIEMRRATRHHTPISMMMVDIDHFKQVNDTHGHPVGDIVLRKVAAQIQHNLRDHDLICRWGGEEFLLLMPESDINATQLLAERIRTSIEQLTFNEIPNHITVSIGLAKVDSEHPLKIATQAADKALYQAKEQGRNRVCS